MLSVISKCNTVLSGGEIEDTTLRNPSVPSFQSLKPYVPSFVQQKTPFLTQVLHFEIGRDSNIRLKKKLVTTEKPNNFGIMVISEAELAQVESRRFERRKKSRSTTAVVSGDTLSLPKQKPLPPKFPRILKIKVDIASTLLSLLLSLFFKPKISLLCILF